MKADYSTIAQFYDVGTGLSQDTLEMWLDLIADLGGAREGSRVLDLGCGTGRFALPMAHRLGFEVAAVDASAEMLSKARAKPGSDLVKWECMRADHLEYPHASFDAIFMSHLLHHVDDPPAVLTECYRVARPSGGAVLIRYGAMDQIHGDVVHTLFPEAMDIDTPRTPTVDGVEQWVSSAGFRRISTREVVQQTYQTGEDCLAAIRAKHISVLTLMSDLAFTTGVERLAQRAREDPTDPWLLHNSLTLTVGYRD
ncbi:class I SAM-dependent methyltransferase [Candidatus Latescibacterota bacterium]